MNRPAARLALGVLAGAAAAVLLPRGADPGIVEPPADVPPGGRAVAATGASMPRWAVAAMGAGVGLAGRKAVQSRSAGDVIGTTCLALLAIGIRRIDVTAGENGLVVTCGIPGLRLLLPRSVITSARVVTVTASEFGGFGLRWTPDRGLGLILRSGDALAVETRFGRGTITVDDPHAVAAVMSRLTAEPEVGHP